MATAVHRMSGPSRKWGSNDPGEFIPELADHCLARIFDWIAHVEARFASCFSSPRKWWNWLTRGRGFGGVPRLSRRNLWIPTGSLTVRNSKAILVLPAKVAELVDAQRGVRGSPPIT